MPKPNRDILNRRNRMLVADAAGVAILFTGLFVGLHLI